MVTRREEIEKLLREKEKTAHDLAQHFNIPFKDVIIDLKHIRLSNRREFVIIPALCKECGFKFTKKEGEVKKPSKCPNCNSERIQEPMFRIKGEKGEGEEEEGKKEQPLGEIFAK